jgi:hypothetical protein
MTTKIEMQELIASAAPLLDAAPRKAPARLKARTYSRLLKEQAATGPLLGLSEVRASGSALCLFEELVRIAAVGEASKTRNCCRVCHARVLAERLEHAPIFWPHCPYAGFQNR